MLLSASFTHCRSQILQGTTIWWCSWEWTRRQVNQWQLSMRFNVNKPNQLGDCVFYLSQQCCRRKNHQCVCVCVYCPSAALEETACWINTLKLRLKVHVCDAHPRKDWQGVVPSHQQNMPLPQTATCSGAVCSEPASDRVSKGGVVSPYAAPLLAGCSASLMFPNAIWPITGCHLFWVCLVGSLPFSRVPLLDDSQNLT